MASIVPRDAHLNQFLTNYLLGYRPQGMIGKLVAPYITVDKQSNNYGVINKGDWLRVENTDRAMGEKPKQVKFSVSSDMYSARNYALGTEVAYETVDNADSPIDPSMRAVEFLKDKLDLDYEVRVEDKCSTGCGSSQTLTGGDAWSNFSTSDPIANLRLARQAVRATTGYRPNTAVLGQKAWDVIQYHPDLVKAAYPGAGVGGVLSLDKFAQIAGVDRVLIGETVKNTGTEGLADAFTDVWSTHCYLFHIAPNPGIMVPTFMIGFGWKGNSIGRGGPGAYQVMQKEDDESGVTRYWTGYYSDEKIVAPELGFKIVTGIN